MQRKRHIPDEPTTEKEDLLAGEPPLKHKHNPWGFNRACQDEDGQIGIMVSKDLYERTGISPGALKAPALDPAIYRPLQPTQLSPGGTPISGRSPGGTVFSKCIRAGDVLFFSTSSPTRGSAKKKEVASPKAKGVCSPPRLPKAHRVLFDDSREEGASADRKMKRARIPSQNRAMAKTAEEVSASKVAEKAGFSPKKREWLHLLGNQFLGVLSQWQRNLTAGTAHANTLMILAAEDLVKPLKEYYGSVELFVWVKEFPDTHVAEIIYYDIVTPDFTLKYEFEAQLFDQPHYRVAMVMDALVDSLILARSQAGCERVSSVTQPAISKPFSEYTTEEDFFRCTFTRPKSPKRPVYEDYPESPSKICR